MIETIFKASKSDAQLAEFLREVTEYARVYVLARLRQKGCGGIGEMTNLKDEFRGVLDELLGYCKEKKYLSGDVAFDMDLVAEEVLR